LRRATPRFAFAVALFAFVGCVERAAEPVATSAASSTGSSTGSSTASSTASSGVRAYRDPVSGAFVPRPAGAPAAPPRAALNGATLPRAPLQETAAPGGGRMVHLQGGFRSHVTATLAPGGLAVRCAVASH
jgi:hypothetical protein